MVFGGIGGDVNAGLRDSGDTLEAADDPGEQVRTHLGCFAKNGANAVIVERNRAVGGGV